MSAELHHGCSIDGMAGLANGSIDCILTDPPFGNKMGYGRSQLGHRSIAGDDNLNWLPQFASNAYRVLKDGAHCVCFWQWRTYSVLEREMLAVGFEIKTVAVWDKGNAGLGCGLAEGYEQIIFFTRGGAKQNRFRSNVFRCNRINGRPIHPHQKPVPLLKELLELVSQKGDIVLDPFMGSGSTGVAAGLTDRKFIGYEINDEHYKTASERITQVNNNGIGLFESALQL